MTPRKIIALFCDSRSIDPVAPHILKRCLSLYEMEQQELYINGKHTYAKKFSGGGELWCIPTATVASYQYSDLVEDLNHNFSDADAVLLVNWHAGANAPAKIFCAHATSDITSGVFGPTSSTILSLLLRLLEEERTASELLSDWKVLPEASHWSGVVVGRPVSDIPKLIPPVFDLEIGSFDSDFNDYAAHEVLAKSIGRLVTEPAKKISAVLFVGGIHFEPVIADVLLQRAMPAGFGHIIPNQWLVSGGYDQPGAEDKLISAVQSDRDKISCIVIHDSLKAGYKDVARKAAAKLNIPCVVHRKLREPAFYESLGV